ncbi:MAG: dihydroorotate dehydrogenase-like protein [bacterium]|nr:dihydroorotate dehydrogenase-like protein [bacterium]
MADLQTKYMGLTLKNPIVIGSSGLTNSVEKIKALEANGAGAVVLKSIFEEQILMEAGAMSEDHLAHAEEMDKLLQYTQRHTLDEYLKLVEESKEAVSIPVIASINCVSPAGWTSFAKKIQDRGADGLELNIFVLPGDYKQKGEDVEKIYFDIINEVREQVSIPIAVKMSSYFSGLANMVFNLSTRHLGAIVLFNHFYSPDIDLEKMEVVSSDVYSTGDELTMPLRWVGILSDHVKCDLAATSGISDGNDIVKCLLVGAKATQIASTIYKNGAPYIKKMLAQIEDFMKKHKYKSLNDFIGKLSHDHVKNPIMYERVQFMKYFSLNKD